MVRAIASETNAVLFDLSPLSIDQKYIGGKEHEKMVASVMVVAKEYQPSIIYIDECEKVWPGKGKKKKGKKGKKKKADKTGPTRITKALGKWKTGWLKDDTRVVIIGCTSEPENCNSKKLKKVFK